MKTTRNLWLMGVMALVAIVFAACGGGSSSAESEAASLPTDGILGELPKVVAEYEAAEAAASAKYDELKKSDPDKAKEALGLPENEEVLMFMDLGYAAEGAGPLPNHSSRKELSETVSYL